MFHVKVKILESWQPYSVRYKKSSNAELSPETPAHPSSGVIQARQEHICFQKIRKTKLKPTVQNNKNRKLSKC